MFYPYAQTTFAGTMQSCTHAAAGTTKEYRWDQHLDLTGAVHSRGLHYTCPAGGESRCTLLAADRVEYYAHEMICAASQDATSLMSFYLSPPEGMAAVPVPSGCTAESATGAAAVKAAGAAMSKCTSNPLRNLISR